MNGTCTDNSQKPSNLRLVNETTKVETRVDSQLVARAIENDRGAIGELVRMHQDMWYRFCVLQLHDDELAKDATQETALRVVKDLHLFRGESQFRTWSFGIALNVCREFKRKRGKYVTLDIEQSGLGEMSCHDGEAVQKITHRESVNEMMRMLESLTDRQREAVVLRHLEELPTEEAAAAMNCAVGTVKATLSQALKRLRELMGVKQ
ncbi:RNA polymerase sigma factor [Planctomycetota bacterium]|nr:RNA polymerase sigma factor [Planctomycetota bacterium]